MSSGQPCASSRRRHGAEIVGEDLGTVPERDPSRARRTRCTRDVGRSVRNAAARPGARAAGAAAGLHAVLTISHRSRPGGTASTRRAGLRCSRPSRAAGALDPDDPAPARRPRCSARSTTGWLARTHRLRSRRSRTSGSRPEPQNRPGTPAIDNFRRRAAVRHRRLRHAPRRSPRSLNRLDSGRRSTAR